MAQLTTGLVTQDLAASSNTALTQVGTIVQTTDGGQAMYVIAQSAIAVYDCVAIVNSSSAAGASICAAPITTTNAATTSRVGFAQTALAAGGYGWVHLSGSNLRCNVATACEPAVQLYTTGTGGVLDDAIVSAGYIAGVVAMTSAASASAVPVLVSFANRQVIG